MVYGKGADFEGMTDRQFDAYQKKVLRTLEQIRQEIQESGSSKALDVEIRDIEEQLKRPLG